MLDPVSVKANACPSRADAGPALGLLEQARAGLLNSVVARKTNPASVVLIRYQRMMDGVSDRAAAHPRPATALVQAAVDPWRRLHR
jgi:hypothetical protein